MFSRLVDRNNFSSVSDSLSQEELAALKRELGALWSYTDSNPTGHYRLDLSRPFDRNLALKVLETNNMERGWRRMADLFDTSDDGFYMNFRNETIDAKSFTWNGVWRIPATGILDFDYVSTERPPFHTPPLDNDLFRELVSDLKRSELSDAQKLGVLQLYTAEEYFSTEQATKIVRYFETPQVRVDAVVNLHRRIIDLENFLQAMMRTLRHRGLPKTYGDDEVPSVQDDMEINEVLRRIGWLNLWNPLDPDVMYRLDLSKRDQNLIARCLVDLAVCEPGENWLGEHLDGKEFELPSTWIKEVPRKGLLEVHYTTDHTSDETIKSRTKRGDKHSTRVEWFKRTLLYQPGMEFEDVGYTGNKRAEWKDQRPWKIHYPPKKEKEATPAASRVAFATESGQDIAHDASEPGHLGNVPESEKQSAVSQEK